MLRCADQALYTGITTDLDRRFNEHQSSPSRGAKYFRSNPPVRVVFTFGVPTRGLASQIESRIKKLNKRDKENLAQGQRRLFDLIEKPHGI